MLTLLLQQSKGKISDQLMQRLKLKPEKIKQLAAGLRSIAGQDEPIGKTLSRMEIAEGLELEKVGGVDSWCVFACGSVDFMCPKPSSFTVHYSRAQQ